jgi:uncharacterized membrane protein HdeD (DUF308 family)
MAARQWSKEMSILAKNWWLLVVRGLVAILLAGLAFAWPGITLTALVFLFGGYAFIDGLVSIAAAVRAIDRREHWGWLLVEGVTGIVAAAVTVMWPQITMLALVFVIAMWAILTGAMAIASAIRLRKEIRGEWLMALSGVASIVFGALVLSRPAVGALVLTLWFGAYMLVAGVLLVALGFRLHSLTKGYDAVHPLDVPIGHRPIHH